MNKIIILAIILISTIGVFAQNKTVECKNRVVDDSEKRDFVGDSFSFDIDGDGKADTVTAKTYKVAVAKKTKSEITENHWISFDLKTSKGKLFKSFFKYKYGDNRADYWIYALVPCGVKAGKSDLLFYAGDDTSDETIILQNTGSSFKVVSRKTDTY